MLKLIKYELIKQKTSKVIIGAILALLEVAFLAGIRATCPDMKLTLSLSTERSSRTIRKRRLSCSSLEIPTMSIR